jgi:hypothetical protein
MQGLNYDDVCRLVGGLYIENALKLAEVSKLVERQASSINELNKQLAAAAEIQKAMHQQLTLANEQLQAVNGRK